MPDKPLTPDLAAAIERDNRLEDAGMHGDDRATCWTHQSWADDCADDPIHTHPSAHHRLRPHPSDGPRA
ncbi:hypothetical protein [Embleya sp. NPDC020630]|uniref:hypothetical protein n=1 Tax=Embleya sp. NPDC020630 TaxID=3363979 RepID=UPI00378E123B